MSNTNLSKIKKMFDHKNSISQAQAARQFNCHQTYICKTLQRHTEIKLRKKQKIPERTEEQKVKIRERCGILNSKYRNLSWIIDDESYFTLKHSSINGNRNYYSSNKKRTPANVKYYKKGKYEKKVLVYVVISTEGVSEPYFVPSGLAVQKVYLNNCIRPKLIPFIQQHHSNGRYVFWPDLASAHYAKTVTNYLDHNGIRYVQKEDNPPNVPEIRPIEDFWSILKGMVYKNNWRAKTLHQLRLRISKCLREINKAKIQRIMSSIGRKLRAMHENGVIEEN